MLSRKNRLPLRTELHRIQKEGKIYHSPFFGLLIAENQLDVARFGLIVSKKIHKKAVKRNRVKRLLRESVRLLLPKLKPGFDVVFLTKRKVLGEDFQAVSSAVKKAFEKAGIL